MKGKSGLDPGMNTCCQAGRKGRTNAKVLVRFYYGSCLFKAELRLKIVIYPYRFCALGPSPSKSTLNPGSALNQGLDIGH